MTIVAFHITYDNKEGYLVQSRFNPQTVISYEQYIIRFYNSNWLGIGWTFLEEWVICLKIYKWNKHTICTSVQKSGKNTDKIPTFSYFKDQKIPTFG